VRGIADALDKIPKETLEDDEADGLDSAAIEEDGAMADVAAYEHVEESGPGEEEPPVPKNS
jgi:hypothetical protein